MAADLERLTRTTVRIIKFSSNGNPLVGLIEALEAEVIEPITHLFSPSMSRQKMSVLNSGE